jgi:hypothetical protein
MLAKFAIETLWNAVWHWYGLVLHPPFLPKPTAFQNPPLLVAALPRCGLLFKSVFVLNLCAFAALREIFNPLWLVCAEACQESSPGE